MRYVKSAIRALLAAGVICAALAGTVSAETADELVIADFEYGTDGFRKSDNVRSIAISSLVGERHSCLEVNSYDLDPDLVRTVKVDFGAITVGSSGISEPIDLEEYQRVAYEVYVPGCDKDPEAEYYMRVILHSEDGSTNENIARLESGEWTTVGIPIGDWQSRSEVVGAEFSLIISSVSGESCDCGFYLDNLRADQRIDRSHTERYMIDNFTVSGGFAGYDDEAERLIVELSNDAQTVITGTAFSSIPDRDVDAIRIRLENFSDADSMTLIYSTRDTVASNEEKSVTVKLERSSDPIGYYLDVGDPAMLRTLSLSFGAGGGNILISSICAVSKYEPTKHTTCGNITDCLLTDDLLSIRFTGDIGRDEVLSNQSGKLRIYAVGPGTELENVEFADLIPIAESPMTTKFDLTAELDGASEDLLTRQFVAISQRPDGSYQLIDDMFYLENPERNAKASTVIAHGRKGIVSSDASLVGELRADSTVIELEAGRIFAARGMGESYICQGATYYIDSDYFTSLKRRIDAFGGAGIGVVLRLTGWSEEYSAELSRKYSLDRFVGFSEYNSTPDGSDFLAAIGSYVAERLCAGGNVTGIILGECENFIGTTDGRYTTLTDMAKGLSLALRTLHSSISLVNSDIQLYLSISNLYSNELSSKTSELGANELIPALCSELDRGGGFEWGLCIEDFYRLTDYDDITVSASDTSSLISLLRSCGVYDTHLIFCDSNYKFSSMRSTERMIRAVESYYAACFNNQIDAVYALLPEAKNDTRLNEVLQWIDSDRSDDISSLILSLKDRESWNELIDGFDSRSLTKKTLTETAASTETPKGIKGRYAYFSFDSFSGVSSFDPGFYCKSLSVVGSDESVLEAYLDPTIENSGSYASSMGIVHRFEYPENFKLTPVLEVKLGITTENSVETVGARLILTSGEARFEARLELTPGEMQTCYIDISDFSGIRDINGIQLLVDGSIGPTTLSLAYINGLSRDYNDESLESVIADERMKKRTPELEDSYRSYIWVGGGVIVGAATVLTVMLLSRKKEENDE